MAEEDILKRADRVLGVASSQATRRELPAGDIEEVVRSLQGSLEARDAPFLVRIVYDITLSMERYIDVVKQNIKAVGEELLEKEKGTHLSVWGIGDHWEGTLLQTNNYTTSQEEFSKQIGGIHRFDGVDDAEAYECAFKRLAVAAYDDKKNYPGSKIATIFIGDSLPHRMKGQIFSDNGCPDGVDYKQELLKLTSTTDLFYFIGCSDRSMATSLQESLINADDPNQKFIHLGKMVEDVPPLLIAAIKLMRNPVSVQDYLRQLPPGQGGRIAGYLALPPPSQK